MRNTSQEMETKMDVDYSLYLVTDSGMLPPGIEFEEQVQRAINGGATIVQLREKELDTRTFIARARAVHRMTQKAGIPLIINDRVDVALAVDCEGVHVGQDDMPAVDVRRLLGPNKLVGISVGNATEASEVLEQAVVDYVGIGPVFETNTKKNMKKAPFGPQGVQSVLQVLRDTKGGEKIRTVAIGGLKAHNLERVLYTAGIAGRAVDGVAIVSEIMASSDAFNAALAIKSKLQSPAEGFVSKSSYPLQVQTHPRERLFLESRPLVHHITNAVVKNFSANVTLAIGASPVMSDEPLDFQEIAKTPNSALVLNIGTPTTRDISMYLSAIIEYNRNHNPVVFDPVGAGASQFRRDLIQKILAQGYATVIKGNESEIFTTAGVERDMRGVDSIHTDKEEKVVSVAKKLALETRSIVVVTGVNDIIVDGYLNGQYHIPRNVEQQAVRVSGGHNLMGSITGSGCSLGSVIASYVSAHRSHPFAAVISAVSLYKEAGRAAGEHSEKYGPGTFIETFLNELCELSKKDSVLNTTKVTEL